MTLTVIPLYLLSKNLFNRRAAFWGCIAFILLPETLLHSNSVMRDPPFFLFAMCAVYFAQKALQSKRLIHLSGSALFAWVFNSLQDRRPDHFSGIFLLSRCVGHLQKRATQRL